MTQDGTVMEEGEHDISSDSVNTEKCVEKFKVRLNCPDMMTSSTSATMANGCCVENGLSRIKCASNKPENGELGITCQGLIVNVLANYGFIQCDSLDTMVFFVCSSATDRQPYTDLTSMFAQDDIVLFTALPQEEKNGCRWIAAENSITISQRRPSGDSKERELGGQGTVTLLHERCGFLKHLESNEQVFFNANSLFPKSNLVITTVLNVGDNVQFHAVPQILKNGCKWRANAVIVPRSIDTKTRKLNEENLPHLPTVDLTKDLNNNNKIINVSDSGSDSDMNTCSNQSQAALCQAVEGAHIIMDNNSLSSSIMQSAMIPVSFENGNNGFSFTTQAQHHNNTTQQYNITTSTSGLPFQYLSNSGIPHHQHHLQHHQSHHLQQQQQSQILFTTAVPMSMGQQMSPLLDPCGLYPVSYAPMAGAPAHPLFAPQPTTILSDVPLMNAAGGPAPYLGDFAWYLAPPPVAAAPMPYRPPSHYYTQLTYEDECAYLHMNRSLMLLSRYCTMQMQ